MLFRSLQGDFTVCAVKFNNSFTLLDLHGYDAVLGCDWLKKHGPVTFDWVNKGITVTTLDQQLIRLPDVSLTKDIKNKVASFIKSTFPNSYTDTIRSWFPPTDPRGQGLFSGEGSCQEPDEQHSEEVKMPKY